MILDGTQLGKYRLLHRLGQGGMGEVYRALDIQMRRQVAVKVLCTQTTDSDDQEAVRLFHREMRANASLDHPHILPCYDYGEVVLPGVPSVQVLYLVMPLREEGTLLDWLRAYQTLRPVTIGVREMRYLPLYEVVRIVGQVASALQHAHDRHILHLDVKLSNVLLRDQSIHQRGTGAILVPDVVLADFGIAKVLRALNPTTSVMRQQGLDDLDGFGNGSRSTLQEAHSASLILGTSTVMPPEQWHGRPVPASDQYALAVLAYTLLTGHVPFQAAADHLYYAHRYLSPVPPSHVRVEIAPAVDAVVLQGLAKSPTARYPTVTAFAHALKEAAQKGGRLYSGEHMPQHSKGQRERPVTKGRTVQFIKEQQPGLVLQRRAGMVRAETLPPTRFAAPTAVDRQSPIEPLAPTIAGSRVSKKVQGQKPRRPRPVPSLYARPHAQPPATPKGVRWFIVAQWLFALGMFVGVISLIPNIESQGVQMGIVATAVWVTIFVVGVLGWLDWRSLHPDTVPFSFLRRNIEQGWRKEDRS